MSNKFRFELNRHGVIALMKSNAMTDICTKYAQNVRNIAGDGYEVGKRFYPERNGAVVRPSTPHAYNSNKKHNTLLKALGSVK